MVEVLTAFFEERLGAELRGSLGPVIEHIKEGRFEQVLNHALVRSLLGQDSIPGHLDAAPSTTGSSNGSRSFDWNDYVFDRLGRLLAIRDDAANSDVRSTPAYLQHFFVLTALAALNAFVQSTVTGPPLLFRAADVLLSQEAITRAGSAQELRQHLVKSLAVDGEAAYKLTPNVELLCLADTILTSPPIKKHVRVADWTRLRVDYVHQRLMSSPSSTLQTQIAESLRSVESLIRSGENKIDSDKVLSQFFLERAAIHTFHQQDKQAREDLGLVTRLRKFDFALTGKLGKRTKWQQKDTSQLVVLAKSADCQNGNKDELIRSSDSSEAVNSNPVNLDLNDDTLLEAITFTKRTPDSIAEPVDEAALPPSLRDLDAGNQPILAPLDSILLLALAASITNTSPSDGLTREETLPYATRILEGGSSNWQVYTQALLLRSRIEGYKSRTTERGLLQLQALVDQVIAETTSEDGPSVTVTDTAKNTTFLPRPKASEAASVSERLQYLFQLDTPTRWELEAELATRWVQLGGLRSALDIYERLEMWPEAALCLAAVDRENEAKRVIRRLLFHSAVVDKDADAAEDDKWEGKERDPAPNDAPRLYCILADIEENMELYERAWEISKHRYARAQRSLGRHYFQHKDFVKAAASYSKALKANSLHGPSWFALGCALLELTEYEKAAEAFARTVQLDDTDAEAWSNLAASLLRKGPVESGEKENLVVPDGDDDVPEEALLSQGSGSRSMHPQQYKRNALNAFKKAATLQHSNFRIWENVMTVALSLDPPVWLDVVAAQEKLITLRGPAEGEKCVDVQALELLARHVITTYDPPTAETQESVASSPQLGSNRYGLARLVVDMVDQRIQPLITNSPRLWRLISTLAVWRRDYSLALDAQEKAWRVVTGAGVGWETGTEEQWNGVVEATIDLADTYESLAPDKWQSKAKNAIKTVLGRAKGNWEGTSGWDKLNDFKDTIGKRQQ